MSRPRPAAPAAALAALVAFGCGPRSLPPKGPFVAVWVGAASEAPRRDELEALARAGAGEVFWERMGS